MRRGGAGRDVRGRESAPAIGRAVNRTLWSVLP